MGFCGKDRLTFVGFLVATFLFLSTLVAVIVLAYYWTTVIHFSKKGAAEAFDSCEDCSSCLTCLKETDGQDLYSFCHDLATVTSCVQQTIFIYDQPNNDQSCYNECRPCATCLKNADSFKGLERQTQPLWYEVYLGLFNPIENTIETTNSTTRVRQESDVGLTNVSSRPDAKLTVIDDVCCGGTRQSVPFTEPRNVAGKQWYPVWFGYSNKPNDYQHTFNVDCWCENNCGHECHVAELRVTFLMTQIKPATTSGYTNKHLLLPSAAKFLQYNIPAYCKSTYN